MAVNRCWCVVYLVDGWHYRYRCAAPTKRVAISECRKYMGKVKIVEAYTED